MLTLDHKIQLVVDLINKQLGGNSVLSLELLVPLEIPFNEIISYCKRQKRLTKQEYDTFIVSFSASQGKTRSLYYLKYKEPFKYGVCKQKSGYNIYPEGVASFSLTDRGDSYEDVDQVIVQKLSSITQSEIEYLRDENKLETFWQAWINAITDNIEIARSTIWSYINFTNYSNEQNNYISSAYILLDKTINDVNTISIINKFLQDFLIEYAVTLFTDKLEKQAARAAISQVMARNMSHNIGSHVLSKFKDESDISSISENKNNQYDGQDSLNLKKDFPKNKLIAVFNEYLKNRMDFLADIATTDPVMETSMYLFRDILKGFDKNRILLNRISGISSTESSTIKTFKIIPVQNGTTITDNLNITNKDPLLSIPNEILGAQAFYILLENIIRNIYKHGNPQYNIEIRIEVKDYEKDASFYELSVYDNIIKEKIDDVVKDRNMAFDKSILENNSLRSNNLGTIEMDVCAAYLRCLPIISVESNKYNLIAESKTEQGREIVTWHPFAEMEIPRLIYAYKQHLTDTEFSLGYKFCISKPKEILVVTDEKSNFNIINCKRENDLSKAGIQLINKTDIEESNDIYNHQIIYSLVSSDMLQGILEKKRSQLPKRIVYFNENISLETSETFIESVWKQYALEFFKGDFSYCIKNGNRWLFINRSDNNIQLANECNAPNCFSVYIDNHNEKWNESAKHKYYDMACSHSKISKLTTRIFQSKKIKIIAEYLEVISTKIIVLDERIQQNISNENREYKANGINTPLTEYFEKQKLLIPSKEFCDLNEVSFGTLQESDLKNDKTVSSAIYRYIKGQSTDHEQPGFVIMHLGILEKMLPAGKDKKMDDIDDLINRLFHKKRTSLVVTSGRGKPNNLPDDIPFVPLALVQNAVETLFDKFLLTKILFNTRKSV